ncbi:MAG: hypothetical protein ACI4O9_02535 [Akkermansia sp.]
MMDDDEMDALTEEQKRQYFSRRSHVAACLDEDAIAFLEERFETNYCCFQGKRGQYDPLDAMRRDAHREVILYLRYIREKYLEAQ